MLSTEFTVVQIPICDMDYHLFLKPIGRLKAIYHIVRTLLVMMDFEVHLLLYQVWYKTVCLPESIISRGGLSKEKPTQKSYIVLFCLPFIKDSEWKVL